MKTRAACALVCALVLCALTARAQTPQTSQTVRTTRPAVSVKGGADGRLVYTSDAQGNRVVDFSHAGYGGGGEAIPEVPARIYVAPEGGDQRRRIQAAIDLVSALPPGADGFRGAVLLKRGTYRIDSSLRIRAGGVVLRGEGQGEDGTVLVATGTSRRSLVVVEGEGERAEVKGSRRNVSDEYVPVGARTLRLESADGLKAGDRVVVRRPSTAEWVALLGMNTFPGWRPENRLHWQPGSRDVNWDRVVVAVEGDRVTLDAPLTTALERRFGGGSLYRYEFPGRIARVGVEGLRLISEHDPARPADEDHAWFAVSLDKVENAWVRQVTALHFVSYVVNAEADAKWLTVEDCEALDPVSEIGGYRRRVFYTAGQLTLFRRCKSRRGRRDFATGHTAAGPNVFLDCSTEESLDYSGPLESWASGVLYDNVKVRGDAIRLINRDVAGQGSGWAAANSVLWNCEATDIEVHSPPGAYNQAYGCKGVVTGDGIVYDPRTMPYRDFYRGSSVEPASLYRAQLAERLGASAVARTARREVPTSFEGARPLSAAEAAAFAAREAAALERAAVKKPLRVEGGHFTVEGERAWTAAKNWSWFQGQMPRSLARGFGPAITRFAPGRTGTGLTDDLEDVAAAMPPRSTFYHHYGLWYDRRRVNHNYYGSPERRTGEVWAPFVELPWARSGVGKAWDGLSKYDLTRFNPWFFERVKQFADVCDRRGLVLYYNFYFQHWLLESRSHYVDFPWRPVNTIQPTGLADEVPAANSFYDLSSPVRRELHALYIRKSLDTLKENTNVVYGIDREYTGPLEFVQFWLDTIAAWSAENGRKVYVSLEIPKAQMDAVLEDPARRGLVTAVDFHHWVYRPDGELFAVRGGINRAPREQSGDIVTEADASALRARVTETLYQGANIANAPEYQKLRQTLWESSKPMRYRAWREYRDRYPELVLLRESDEYPELSRAVERSIPREVRASTRPAPLVLTHRDTSWVSADPGRAYVVYTTAGEAVELDLSGDANVYEVAWLDSATGRLRKSAGRVRGGGRVTLAPPKGGAGRPRAAWLSKVD
ncbi:MAG TPA: DUF6298 domain-containing protein [Pyrinomonadaceae bacterium]